MAHIFHIVTGPYADEAQAERHAERIGGVVALAHDDVRARGKFVHTATRAPAQFVEAYLDEGFEEELRIQP